MSTQCQSTIAQHGSNQHGNEPRSIEQHNTDQNNTEQQSIVRRSMAQCRGALQNMLHRIMQWLYRTYEAIRVHTVSMWSDESGMSTVEYAIGTIAAAAFGAVLIAVVKSDSVQQSLLNIIQQALNIH